MQLRAQPLDVEVNLASLAADPADIFDREQAELGENPENDQASR